jgi:hypothetical protein
MTAPRATVIVALMNSLSRLAPVALSSSRATLGARVDDLDWPELLASLDESGFAIVSGLVDEDECARLARLYDTGNFRSRVIMSRHGFGRGEYQYFAYPLPDEIQQLRSTLYSRLVPLANQWQEHSGCEPRFPERHEQLLARCHAAGQLRPTPLLLRYGAGDFNCLHQDLYGEQVFPLQMAVLLSRPDVDFTGGEFVLTEQRPRQQSRVEVVPLCQGDAVIFAVNERPVRGSRGFHRVRMRHGVSRVRAGQRHTLGVILHDAA